MSDLLAKAARAKSILECDEWKEAWTAYRTRILDEIEAAKSDDEKRVMHLKRLLAAAIGARKHLELIVADGAIAAQQIEIDDRVRKFSLFQRG